MTSNHISFGVFYVFIYLFYVFIKFIYVIYLFCGCMKSVLLYFTQVSYQSNRSYSETN